MVAQAIHVQTTLEFLVAAFALPALDVVLIGGFGQHLRARPIAEDKTTVAAVGVGLRFDDDPTRRGPTLGPIPKGVKQATRGRHGLSVLLGLLTVLLISDDRLFQQCVADTF